MSDLDLNRELERAREAGDLDRVVPIVAAIDAGRATLYWDGTDPSQKRSRVLAAADAAFRFSYLISHHVQDGLGGARARPSPFW